MAETADVPTEQLRVVRLEAESPRPERSGGARGFHWWLLRGATPVAYCRTVVDPREPEPHLLREVEVRQPYRGRGYCGHLLTEAEASIGLLLHRDGLATELGAPAVARLPLATGATEEVAPPSFYVEDWDQLLPRYR